MKISTDIMLLWYECYANLFVVYDAITTEKVKQTFDSLLHIIIEIKNNKKIKIFTSFWFHFETISRKRIGNQSQKSSGMTAKQK